jgi:mercuric ion transport protein
VKAHKRNRAREDLKLKIIMDANETFKAGIWGSIIAAICCFTPILVVALGLIGLAALTPYLDYVLFPLLGFFLVLAVYGWRNRKRSC